MTAYILHQPLPMGLPPGLGARAWACIQGPDDLGYGALAVHGSDTGFNRLIRARLLDCYGFSGGRLRDRVTQDDLHCAMACLPMRELTPRWLQDWQPTMAPGSVSVGG